MFDFTNSLQLRLQLHVLKKFNFLQQVDEIVQGQLITFEAVLKGCDPQIKDSLRKELEKQTRQWLAVRQKKNIPKDIVDTYAEMALEIITRGKTKHATEFTEL